jgi:hypothetical protein
MRPFSAEYPNEDRFNITPEVFLPSSEKVKEDVTTAKVYSLVRIVAALAWDACGYLDVIEQRTLATPQQLADMQEAVKVVQSQIADLRASLDRIIDFLGVSIPAWSNKEEVEKGDDMGISHPSAASLELAVDFQFERQVAGFGHEDVIRIDPPAGTLVKRGSTVTVTLNLEG